MVARAYITWHNGAPVCWLAAALHQPFHKMLFICSSNNDISCISTNSLNKTANSINTGGIYKQQFSTARPGGEKPSTMHVLPSANMPWRLARSRRNMANIPVPAACANAFAPAATTCQQQQTAAWQQQHATAAACKACSGRSRLILCWASHLCLCSGHLSIIISDAGQAWPCRGRRRVAREQAPRARMQHARRARQLASRSTKISFSHFGRQAQIHFSSSSISVHFLSRSSFSQSLFQQRNDGSDSRQGPTCLPVLVRKSGKEVENSEW